MCLTPPPEFATTIATAASSEGKSPRERMATFVDLLALVDGILGLELIGQYRYLYHYPYR